MKVLLFILISFIITTSTRAGMFSDEIKIGSNATTSKLELRLNSSYKKITKANIVILNAKGKKVNEFKCAIKKGSNTVCMQDALNLDEGVYTVNMTVKKKTSSTKFVLFK